MLSELLDRVRHAKPKGEYVVVIAGADLAAAGSRTAHPSELDTPEEAAPEGD